MENNTNKRKASPEITSDDAAGKRMRLDEDRTSTPPRNNADILKAEGALDDFNPTRNEDGSSTGKSPTTRHVDRDQSPRRSPAAQRRPSATVATGPPTRRNVSQEEKKRGQRLFGGLVSTLNRSASGPQQQRRREIEKRQQERAQQRRVEDEKRRAEKLAGLKRRREIAQVELDEQAVCYYLFPFRDEVCTGLMRCVCLDEYPTLGHVRQSPQSAHKERAETCKPFFSHSASAIPASAIWLTPSQYYLPWELTTEQNDIVEDQVDEAEETIAHERQDFKARKEQRLRALGVVPLPRSPSPLPQESAQKPDRGPEPGPKPEAEPEAEPELEVKPVSTSETQSKEAAVDDTGLLVQDISTKDIALPSPKVGNTTEYDEHGDEVLHDEEDTVIY